MFWISASMVAALVVGWCINWVQRRRIRAIYSSVIADIVKQFAVVEARLILQSEMENAGWRV